MSFAAYHDVVREGDIVVVYQVGNGAPWAPSGT